MNSLSIWTRRDFVRIGLVSAASRRLGRDPWNGARGGRYGQFRRHRRRRSGRRLVVVHQGSERLERQSGRDRQCAVGYPQRAGRRRRHRKLRRDQHRRRHAKAAGRQRPDRAARHHAPSGLEPRPQHRGVSRQGYAGVQLHRLSGQAVRRSDRAAGQIPSPICRRRPVRSTPTPRCSIRNSRATSRSRTITPPPARRPRFI